MKTFIRLHREIVEQAINMVRTLIDSKGEESKHSNKKCLKVTNDDHKHNLSGDRYLTEINAECLVDDSGYEYNFYVLDTEDFLSTIDYLIVKYTKK
jgi:hypothetical protein